eukprot:1892485-Karenia_brevis.AAC.1
MRDLASSRLWMQWASLSVASLERKSPCLTSNRSLLVEMSRDICAMIDMYVTVSCLMLGSAMRNGMTPMVLVRPAQQYLNVIVHMVCVTLCPIKAHMPIRKIMAQRSGSRLLLTMLPRCSRMKMLGPVAALPVNPWCHAFSSLSSGSTIMESTFLDCKK